MKLARVTGTVWATRKIAGLKSQKLLILQSLSFTERKPYGVPLVAVDTVQAGPGDMVLYVTSREASLPLEPWFVPVDATIVGVVDQVSFQGQTERFH